MIQTSPETSPLLHVETRKPLHQYLDTEYVSILSNPPPCSVNGITKLRSSFHTTVAVVQTNTTKTQIHVILMLIMKIL